jgi:hypothetical protein
MRFNLPEQPNNSASDEELKQTWPPKYYRGLEVSLNRQTGKHGIYYTQMLPGGDSDYMFDEIMDADVSIFKKNSEKNRENMNKEYERYYQTNGGNRRNRKSKYKKRIIKHKRNNTKKYRRSRH